MADFGNIYIGGKHFTSLQEAIEYKKQHPEWDGIGQIIDRVGPGESVSFTSGKQKITLSDTPNEKDKEKNKDEEPKRRNVHFGSFNIKNDFSGEHITYGKGTTAVKTSNRHIVISNNSSVTVNRGGKSYELRGGRLEKIDGRWFRDGQPVDWSELGGEYEEQDVVSITINGDVQELTTTTGNVTVNGDVNVVKTGTGDVHCDNAVKVSTGTGDVHCDTITGSVSTGMGNIYHNK